MNTTGRGQYNNEMQFKEPPHVTPSVLPASDPTSTVHRLTTDRRRALLSRVSPPPALPSSKVLFLGTENSSAHLLSPKPLQKPSDGRQCPPLPAAWVRGL